MASNSLKKGGVAAEVQADSAPVEQASLVGHDMRRALARRYRAIFQDVVAAIGGGTPRAEQILIARQAAMLAQWLENQSIRQTNGEAIDPGQVVNATNAFSRLLESIGADPSKPPVDRPPDPFPGIQMRF